MKTVRYFLAIAAALALSCGSAMAQVEISSPVEGAVSTLRNQAVIGQAPANLPLRLDINGLAVDSVTVRPDGVFEFLGVPTPEGDVRYTVTATMRSGKTFFAERSIHILGAPDSIVLDMPVSELPADGAATVNVAGSLLDRWGVRIPDAYMVTIVADSLTVIAVDADQATRGVQVPVLSGEFSFALKSSNHVGPVTVSLEANGVTARRTLYLTTPKQPFMLIGSLTATGSYLGRVGEAGDFDSRQPATDGFNHRERIAITGRGTLLDRYLVTLSVDSDRKLKDRLYRDLDPNVLYGIYGDNSTVAYEAQSASPVYVKVEQNQSYVMYGDFNTGLTTREFAAYNRTFTGGKLHVESPVVRADLFGTVTNRKAVQEELRGMGVSGYYFLRNSNIVSGSEKVRVEVRDRLRTDVVISSQEKARISDYDIDYTQGTLYFKQPVPSLDEHENPVYIVVSSEAITSAADNYVVGGTGEVTLFSHVTLGATTVVEQRAPANYILLGSHGGIDLGAFGAVRGEVARSSEAGQQGYAWKVEGELTPFGKALSIRPYYRLVDGTFNNTMQRGGGQEVGTRKYGASGSLDIFAGTRLEGELYRQTQTAGQVRTNVQAITGALRQTLWSGGGLTAKVEDIRYDGPGLDSNQTALTAHSTFLSGRVDATIVDGIAVNLQGEYDMLHTGESVKPNSIGGGVEIEILKDITLFADEKLLEGGGGITSAGIRSKIGDHTTLDGRYEIGNAIAGSRSAASIGLRNRLRITDEVTANVLFEKTKDLSRNLIGARTPDHDAVSVAFEYLPTFPLKASVKGEYAGSDNTKRIGLVYAIAGRLFDRMSLLARGSYYRDAGEQSLASTRGLYVFGIAYRPTADNWLNLLGQIELRTEGNQIVQPAVGYRSVVGWAHASIVPFAGAEIGVKYALKSALEHAGEFDIRTLTDLIQGRVQYDVASFLNVAVEGRMLRQYEVGDRRLGWSAEAGVVVLPNLMLVGGYNFEGYAERDLIDNVYSAAGPYVTVRAKFTERLFGFGD